jgi:hypothetical protein
MLLLACVRNLLNSGKQAQAKELAHSQGYADHKTTFMHAETAISNLLKEN